MWQAKIAEKSRIQGSLKVLIAYSNGMDDFTEYVTVSTAESLPIVISSRLDNLNALDTFTQGLSLGAFTPVAKDTSVEARVESPLDVLANLKYLVDLGVKEPTDPDYQEALQTAKDNLK